MINEEEAYSLMAKKLASGLGTEEERVLREWVESSAANQEASRHFGKIWEEAGQHDLVIDTDAAWKKVEQRTPPKVFRLHAGGLLRIAAAIIAFGIIGFIAYNNLKQPLTTITTAANEVKKISLPDGSTVWLHEYSSLSFSNNLKGSERKLTLDGLAFFDVERDEKHPFVITTPKGNVEVLGTSFEVSAYKNDTFERVTVSTGKVKFENAQTHKSMLLTRNKEGVLAASGYENIAEVNASDLVSWKTSRLTFSDEPMEKVAEKIGRYFHVRVKLENEAIANCRFTGTFSEPVLGDVIDAVSKALQLSYDRKGDRISFNGDGCKAE